MLTILKTLGVSAAVVGGTCLSATEAQARHCCRTRCCEVVQPTCCAPACAAPAVTPAPVPAPATDAPPPPAEPPTAMRWDGQRYQSAYQPAARVYAPMRRVEPRDSGELGANRKFLGKFGE